MSQRVADILELVLIYSYCEKSEKRNMNALVEQINKKIAYKKRKPVIEKIYCDFKNKHAHQI